MSRGCLLLHGTWSYLRFVGGPCSPTLDFVWFFLDYDYVWHNVNFAFLYTSSFDWGLDTYIFASQVSDSLTLIYPLADLVATELPPNGQCELSLLSETLEWTIVWYFFYLDAHTSCEHISPLSFRRKSRIKTCLSDLNDSTLVLMSCSIFPSLFS